MTLAMPSPQRPLSGLRVLDFTAVLAGPYCTRILADLGAEVLKVEPPEGDQKRLVPPMRDGHSASFAQVGAGKRSLVLDLKTPEDRADALELAAGADILVENWRPGVAARLGLGYEQLSETCPELIYCSISGYGQTGPKAQRPAYAPIIHAESGFEIALSRFGASPDMPTSTGIFIGDVFAGMSAVAAINAAVLQRQASGLGQHIDVSMYECMLNMLGHEVNEAQFGEVDRRIYPPLPATDGYVVVAPTSLRNFESLDRALPELGLSRDPRFAATPQRLAHWPELMARIGEWTSKRSRAECEAHLIAAGVPCAAHHSVAESFDDPQVRHRGSFATVEDAAGDVQVPVAPFRFSSCSTTPAPTVSAFGEAASAWLTERHAFRGALRPQAKESN